MSSNVIESEVIGTVSQRIEVLECVLEQPMDKRTLEEHLSVSRSTLDRAVRELELLELIEYVDGAYRATTCGCLASRKYREFEQVIQVLAEFRPFLQHVSPSEFDLDLCCLGEANLLVPKPNNPYEMINRHVQLLKNTDYGRGLLPVTGLHAHEAAHEAVVDGGARHELIVEPGVADTLRSNPRYAELTEEMIATGRVDLYVYDGEIPYFVGVFDEKTVQLGADEDGEPRALLEVATDEVREWANSKLDKYKQRAAKQT